MSQFDSRSGGSSPPPARDEARDRSYESRGDRGGEDRGGDSRRSPPPTRTGETHRGTVKWFNAEKGFGFITSDRGEDIFVHQSSIYARGYRNLEQEEGPR